MFYFKFSDKVLFKAFSSFEEAKSFASSNNVDRYGPIEELDGKKIFGLVDGYGLYGDNRVFLEDEKDEKEENEKLT